LLKNDAKFLLSWSPVARNLIDYLATFGKGFFRKRRDYLSVDQLEEMED
jgi:hypothetical protein